jgi:hypothetical protein
MKDWSAIQERYLRDTIPIRLGGLAANLRRIRAFTSHDGSREAVAGLIEESKFFIEWTARETEIETAAELVELQVQLARWSFTLFEIWPDPSRRHHVAEQSLAWSERVLALSGLLKS